jgi:hypothetical protein
MLGYKQVINEFSVKKIHAKLFDQGARAQIKIMGLWGYETTLFKE